MSTVQDRLTALLVSRFGVQESDLHQGTTFTELDLDSLTLVEVALAVQKEFGVPISEDDLTPEGSVQHLVALIDTLSPSGATQG
jgi:acyl carrier protein